MPVPRPRIVYAVAVAAFIAWSMPAWADDRPACERFDWPLSIERALFAAPALPVVETGVSLPAMPDKGFSLKLKPASDVSLPAPPSRTSKLETSRSGVATFDLPVAGLYQVTISADGWLDVVQDGVALQAISHTGNRECIGLRKSVRFKLKSGPVAIQVTGVSAEAVSIAVRSAD